TISEHIALQIDDVEITVYEFERNLNQFEQSYLQAYRSSAPADSIRKWIQNFKDEMFILAEAYRKGYDESEDLKKLLSVSDRAIITQVRGPWYQREILSKIDISEQELKEA